MEAAAETANATATANATEMDALFEEFSTIGSQGPPDPYAFFGDASRQMMYGGAAVTRWRPA